jgi:hypothetical protein
VAIPKPEPGLVISYAYLWYEEAQSGREEASKDRPCAIILATEEREGETIVTVVPITHTSPAEQDAAVEIPLATKKRLGLDDARSWMVVSETNRFVWPGPDLRPIRRSSNEIAYGFLPPKLFREARDRLVALYNARRHRSTRRSE